jgi:predicted DNA-binding ArsR family transcriptional regulator
MQKAKSTQWRMPVNSQNPLLETVKFYQQILVSSFIEKGMQKWDELINNSFLSDENKKALKELIENRANQLEFYLVW